MIYETIFDECWIVRATKAIDLSNVREFEAALDGAIKKAPKGFVLDLAETSYMDSIAIKAIFAAYQQVSDAGGRLSIVIKSAAIKRLFDVIQLSGLPALFISEDLESAKQALA